jgi:hypothetical protein
MPASEAQLRASKKWNEKNKERVAQYKSNWVENNRDKHRESCRLSMKHRYDVSMEFKTFRKILLDL